MNEREYFEQIKSYKLIANKSLGQNFLVNPQIAEKIVNLFLKNVASSLKIYSNSFGFKYGIPKEADLVFDVRCLPNPFYIPELKNYLKNENIEMRII